MIHLKNILIIDGSYFLHRNLKQPNLWEMRNSELERTGGLYGFLNTFQKELKISGVNYYPIVCWDDGLSPRRLAVYDNYKKHKDHLEDPDRKPFNQMTDDELDEDYVYNYKLQRKKLIEILNSFGIPNLMFKGVEGDDLIAWVSKHCEKSKILTDDADMIQLLTETCRIRRPMHETELNLKSYLEENQMSDISEFINKKAFLGDSSDNIPSACYGVGEKFFNEFFKCYKLLKENNQLEMLKEEKALKEFCKANDIKFRAAYGNFDENQFFNNLELVDLRKIKDDEIPEDAIYEAIKRVYKNKDVIVPMHLLNRYEIKTINTNVIFEALIMARHNIKEID